MVSVVSKYTPHLFIAIGETGAMYTLRETFLHVSYDSGKKHTEVRSEHLFNLSTDADAAFSKASVHADQIGLELRSTREELDREMRKIKRMTDAEIKQRGAQSNTSRDALREAPHSEKMLMIEKGIYPVGRYANMKFHEADPKYITWLSKNIDSMESELMKSLAKAVAKHCAHMILPDIKEDATLAKIGDSISVSVVVIAAYAYENKWKATTNVTKMTTPDGIILVVKSSTFKAKIGSRFTLSGIIKGYDSFKGQSQTQIAQPVRSN
jgi:hypothetical protein